MFANPVICPDCKLTLVVRGSWPIGDKQKARLVCRQCDFAVEAIVRPAEIESVRHLTPREKC